jgi:hypothetical protein
VSRGGRPAVTALAIVLCAAGAAAQPVVNQADAEKLLNEKIAMLGKQLAVWARECATTRPATDIECVRVRAVSDYTVLSAIEQTPLATPVATGRFTPGAGVGDSGVEAVAGPSLPKLFALATENNVVDFGKDKTTLTINPFLFVGWANPNVLDRQSEYEKYATLRRFAGSVSFGGAGERLDRDGDGQIDPIATVENPLDILTWELQWQAFGTRDRRARENFESYLAAVSPIFTQHNVVFAEVLTRWKDDIIRMSNAAGMISEAEFKQFLERDDVGADLMRLASLRTRLTTAHGEQDKAVDRSMVWTLTFGATHQPDEFGPDRIRFGAKGVWGFFLGSTLWDSTVSASYVHAQEVGVLPDADSFNIGWKGSTKLLKTHALVANGIDWAASASAEHYNDVPGAIYDTIVKANTTLTLNFTKSISVPLSVTYANHRDLLTKEKKVFGHIALSYDLPTGR